MNSLGFYCNNNSWSYWFIHLEKKDSDLDFIVNFILLRIWMIKKMIFNTNTDPVKLSFKVKIVLFSKLEHINGLLL